MLSEDFSIVSPKYFPAPFTVATQVSRPNFRASLMLTIQSIEFHSAMIVSVNQFMRNRVFSLQSVIQPILAEGHSDFRIKSSGGLNFRSTRNTPNLGLFTIRFGERVKKEFHHWTGLKEPFQIFLASTLFKGFLLLH